MVAPLGFAPRPRGLEPPVLLLHYRASSKPPLVDPKGVEPSICLLAKQMPLPRSSHGPISKTHLFSDQRAAVTLSLHHLEETDGIEPSLSVWNP